jgi:hypothetical protein
MKPLDDDPFEMFGESDDDTDDEHDFDQNEATTRSAQSLKEMANRVTSTPTAKEVISNEMRSASIDVSSQEEIAFPWRRPLYFGPMKLVFLSKFGGGRGYIASKDVAPGTLMLVEKPVLSWPLDYQDDTEFGLSTVQAVLHSPSASELVRELEHFHPTKRTATSLVNTEEEEVDVMMSTMRENYKDDPDLKALTDFAARQNIRNSDETQLSEMDCLRILLAIRYNSLESGVYLHVAMLNHACQPNCVKFLPDGKSYSEVRSTRPLHAGEPMTISYVPRILSHASRRKHLYDQHRFDIGTCLPQSLFTMELISGVLPSSNLDCFNESSTTSRIETACSELRELFNDADEALKSTSGPPSLELSEQLKYMEQASNELYKQAIEQLNNDCHLLLIPCLELHLDCADLVQKDTLLCFMPRVMLLGRVVSTAVRLLELQGMLYGPDHFELARTNLDLSQAIEELLSKSSKQLLGLDKEGYDNLSAWSSLAHRTYKEHKRIKGLYPYDVDKFVATGR